MKKLFVLLVSTLLILSSFLLIGCKSKKDPQPSVSTSNQILETGKRPNVEVTNGDETSQAESETIPQTDSEDTTVMGSEDSADEHVHEFGEWKTTKTPTCTENGKQMRECNCGEKEGQEIEATGHKFGEWKTTRKATCAQTGEEARTCVCGEKEKREIETDPENHSYKSEKKSASCNDPGGLLYTCIYCQDEYFEETEDPLGGHKLNIKGICTRCEEDFSTDMSSLVGPPHSDSMYGFSYNTFMDYLSFSWQATNLSGKTIKYCNIQVDYINGVGDIVRTKTYKITGPIDHNGTISIVKSNEYFNGGSSVSAIQITNISLEYLDGSMDAGYYGYTSYDENYKLP